MYKKNNETFILTYLQLIEKEKNNQKIMKHLIIYVNSFLDLCFSFIFIFKN